MSKKVSSVEDQPMQRVLRQRELVENYKHDNEVLKLDLTRESRDAKRSTSTTAAADISRLQDEATRYIQKINAERRKVEEVEAEIGAFQQKIMDQKARLGGVNAAQVNNQLIQKQIRVLEYRMDKGLVKFNETLAQNKVLRHKIDEYRRERVVFDVIYKRLERDLHEKKKEMAAIIEDSKNAYQARDKSQAEMASLTQHAEKEKADFEQEFKIMGDFIKQQQQLLEQMRLKQFDRSNDKTKTLSITSDEPTNEMQNNMMGMGAWGNQGKDKSAPLSQEKIHSYVDALRRIQETTGIYDVNEIVTRFLEAEEQNFSLFNYVNDINSEIERLEHSISDMRNQIEKYRGQGMSTDTQRKKTLRDLDDKLKRTESKADEYEERYQQAVRTITQLKNGIHSIFTRIGAASASVDETLGNQGVTESNMMQYLGIIEQRTTEILQTFANSQSGIPENSMQMPDIQQIDGSSRLQPQPPSFEDMSSGDESEADEDERPLTRQELEKKTMRELTKKVLSN